MTTENDHTTTEKPIKKKRAEWIKHDTDAHRDEKLLQLRAAGGWEYIGLWWTLVEVLAVQDEYALKEKSFAGTAIFLSLSPDKFLEFINACVEADLLKREGGFIFSTSLRTRLSKLGDISEKRAEAGAKGAAAKKEAEKLQPEQAGSKPEANAKQNGSKCLASDISISVSNSNSILSSLLSDPSFGGATGVRYTSIDEIAAQQLLANWLSSGLERADFADGIRAYDAWKGKLLEQGKHVNLDDARALMQPWVKTEVLKLKNEFAKLNRTRGGASGAIAPGARNFNATVDAMARIFEKEAHENN